MWLKDLEDWKCWKLGKEIKEGSGNVGLGLLLKVVFNSIFYLKCLFLSFDV